MLWNTTHKSCIYAMRTQKMRRRHFPLRNIFTFTHAREREPRCAYSRLSALRTQRCRCHACVRIRTFCVLNDSRERWGETSYAGRKRENDRGREEKAKAKRLLYERLAPPLDRAISFGLWMQKWGLRGSLRRSSLSLRGSSPPPFSLSILECSCQERMPCKGGRRTSSFPSAYTYVCPVSERRTLGRGDLGIFF